MTRAEQAGHIWKHLFRERTPISEACRGVVTTLQKLGLDPGVDSLERLRGWFREQDPSEFVDRVMELSNVESITMTNEVFDENERSRWLADPSVGRDPRFRAVLRIDKMLLDWPGAAASLSEWGFDVSAEPNAHTIEEGRRFLREWLDRMQAIYIAV